VSLVADWQRADDDRLTYVVITRGDEVDNTQLLRAHADLPVLLAGARVQDTYGATSTPSAVVLAANGRIAAEIALGTDAIATLHDRSLGVARSLRTTHVTELAATGAAVADGAPRIGDPAPNFTLTTIGGEEFSSEQIADDLTLLLFWRASGSHCRSMVDDVLAHERDAAPGSLRVVLVNRGAELPHEPFASPVLLDPAGAMTAAYHAYASPSGVLVDHRRIASPIALGADAIRSILGPTAVR
jgi:hypothetical protein